MVASKATGYRTKHGKNYGHFTRHCNFSDSRNFSSGLFFSFVLSNNLLSTCHFSDVAFILGTGCTQRRKTQPKGLALKKTKIGVNHERIPKGAHYEEPLGNRGNENVAITNADEAITYHGIGSCFSQQCGGGSVTAGTLLMG
jgi:hypothetical protein